MAGSGKATVIFLPSGRSGEVELGVTVTEASRQLGVEIEALCGHKRICGKCKIRIEEGFWEKFGVQSSGAHVSAWQEEETGFIDAKERQEGFRLGCLARVQGNVVVFVPEESRADRQVVNKYTRDIPVEWNPAVKYYALEITAPVLTHPGSDLERLTGELHRCYGLQDLRVDYLALKKLSSLLKKPYPLQLTAAVWMDQEIIAFLPGAGAKGYGLAVDIGTTTVAAYLCDLITMEVISTVAILNPQRRYGEDVMSRISYQMTNADGLEQMSRDIVAGLNDLIAQACREARPAAGKQPANQEADGEIDAAGAVRQESPRLRPSDLIDMTIVGNTTMHHLLLQLDPSCLGRMPFQPVLRQSLDIKARELGIKINQSAYVHLFPNVAGFVGADNVGVLLAEEPYKSDEMQLIIDIGTNGELVLGNRNGLLATSCATGPALEGGALSFGMRAAPGAIERIKIDPESHEVDYKVVGRAAWKSCSQSRDMKVRGICGSGILDSLAELYRTGIIRKSGQFSAHQKSSRYRLNPDTGQPEFVIAWKEETAIAKDVVISQKDIRQIQLAKGALYCGCKLLMRRLDIDRVDRVKIAGAFGTQVDRQNALIIGLLPDCPLDKIVAVGNAAGDGARLALLNRTKRAEADWVSRKVEFVELSRETDFEEQFIRALQVPHMEDAFPHLEGIVPPEILHQS
jgi:uncharacterized 2Fe-2S/4Fe-4S cluster protein (DUF4445 family)